MNESDPRWPEIRNLVQQKNGLDLFQTQFSAKEILGAEWLRVIPWFEHGYPQPEDTWVTSPINYAEVCSECGTYRQVSNYRIKAEPRLGKHDFMNLTWCYDLFCTPAVLSDLRDHHIFGYEVWDAILHKTNLPAQTISQLYIPAIAGPGLTRVDDLTQKQCPKCHIAKYFPHMKGILYFQRQAVVPGVDIMLSYEWFGDGHAAYREIIISNRLARLILEKKWKGVKLKVVELV